MDPAAAASASGMEAAQQMFDVAAGNIANWDTAGYQAQDVTLVTAPDGGVTVGSIAAPAGSPMDPYFSGVDMSQQMVALAVSSGMYGANARALMLENQTAGSLIDILA